MGAMLIPFVLLQCPYDTNGIYNMFLINQNIDAMNGIGYQRIYRDYIIIGELTGDAEGLKHRNQQVSFLNRFDCLNAFQYVRS